MSKPTHAKQVVVYANETGKEPFSEWLHCLRDGMARKRILVRIERLAQGNYGDCVALGEGIQELRMFFGSGYRVYFAEKEEHLVILLSGGDKNTQAQDIKNAKLYWKEYLENEGI